MFINMTVLHVSLNVRAAQTKIKRKEKSIAAVRTETETCGKSFASFIYASKCVERRKTDQKGNYFQHFKQLHTSICSFSSPVLLEHHHTLVAPTTTHEEFRQHNIELYGCWNSLLTCSEDDCDSFASNLTIQVYAGECVRFFLYAPTYKPPVITH